MLEHSSFAKRRILLLTVLLFGTIAAARLVLLRYFGYDIPYWDQWDSECWILLRPFQTGELDWKVLFSPHNEHRILWTRLTTLAIFVANDRQWDNLVSICFNAFFYSATFALFLRRTMLELPWRGYLPLFALILLVACLPFSQENVLSGFQSQFYYMIAFTVVGIWLASIGRPTYGRIAGLTVIALACIFTMASGALGLLAFFAGAVLRWWRERSERWRLVLLGSLLIPLFLIAMAAVPKIAGHEPLRAQNSSEFVHAAILTLSWPFPAGFGWALLLWVPSAWGGVQILRRQIADPFGIAAFSLGAWVVVQALAMAYVRGHYATEVASRYTDVVVLGLLVNAYFAIRFCRQTQNKSRWPIFVVSCLLVSYAGAMLFRAKQGVEEMASHAAFSRTQINNVRHFVATDDLAELRRQPLFSNPYPDPDRLAMMLRDPTVRNFLPSSVRPAMPLSGNDVFVANGYFPTTSGNVDRPTFGSYSPTSGDRAIGHLSTTLRTRFSYLDFSLAGYPDDPGMTLSLVSTYPQREQPIRPLQSPKESWSQVVVPVPAAEFALEASDRNTSSWFAFTAPVEIGRLSLWVMRLLDHAILIAILFAIAFALALLYFWFDFWPNDQPDESSSVVAGDTTDTRVRMPRFMERKRVLRNRNPEFDSAPAGGNFVPPTN